MKRLTFAFCLSFLIQFGLYGQDSTRNLSVNFVSGGLSANGILFRNVNNEGYFRYPTASSNMISNFTGVWLSGTDQNSTIHSSIQYPYGFQSDLIRGPLGMQLQLPDSLHWNKVYGVPKDKINKHLASYNKNDYITPSDILTWPGNGTSPFSTVLAPFVDWNQNQLYEPQLGDVPYIRGDAMLFSICNDLNSSRVFNNSLPLGIELHTSLYAFSSSDQVFGNMMVVRYVVFNRSQNNYHNFRFSILVNGILGDDSDNFISTDVVNKSVVLYNGTSNDAVYGSQIPYFAAILLNKDLNSTLYLTDDFNPLTGKPTADKEVQNLMQGRWKNGKSLTFGGDGTDGNNTCKYVYSDSTDTSFPLLKWNEELAGNAPGKRMFLLNSDSVVFNSGDALVYEFAFFVADEPSLDLKKMYEKVNILQDLYSQGRLSGMDNTFDFNRLDGVNMYPNPLLNSSSVYFAGLPDYCIEATLVDLYGNVIEKKCLDSLENMFILEDHLAAGIYYITLNFSGENKIFKLIIQ